jgi:hypothetical protein
MRKSRAFAAVVTVVTVAVAASVGMGIARAVTPAGTAFPDPPPNMTWNVWGAHTTQDVSGALTQGYAGYPPGLEGQSIGSWNSINPTTGACNDSVTPVTGGDTFERPCGSGDGRAAVSAANNLARSTWVSCASGHVNALTASAAVRQQEISVARSASLPPYSTWVNAANPGVPNQLTFIPQAIDAVGVLQATFGTAAPIAGFTTAELTAIYTNHNLGSGTNAGDIIAGVGGPPLYHTARSGNVPVVPVLPTACSGTRAFFLSAINAVAFASNTVANESGPAIQMESDGTADLAPLSIQTALNQNSVPYTVPANAIAIVPFSGAEAIAQRHGIQAIPNTANAANFSFPMIDGKTLLAGTGVAATIGTLQGQVPVTAFGANPLGVYARYAWAVVPSSFVTGTMAQQALVTWLDTTAPQAVRMGGVSVWSDFGFKPLAVGFAANPANWILTMYLN